jgi:uncharacterized protein (TIGR02001 family)
MKKTLLAVAMASSFTSFGAIAADKAPEPSYTLTGNIGLVSDYRFRGVSQTQKGPAVQGGLDLALANGLSFGTWTSNVSQWANLGGSQEVDLYGAFSKEVAGVSLSVGGIQYWYPRNIAGISQNTFEYFLSASYGPISYKISQANGDWFGVDADGATYHDLTASLGSLGLSDKYSFSIHVGKQTIKEQGVNSANNFGFIDYSIKAGYAISDSLSAAITASRVKFSDKADAEANWFSFEGKKLGGSAVVASITKTF